MVGTDRDRRASDIIASIWFVTGISPREHQTIRSKGDAYRVSLHRSISRGIS